MTQEISVQRFKDAVLDVLTERGDDFVYEVEGQCLYSADHGQSGSCLFGAAFIDKLGVEWHEDWEEGDLSLYQILQADVNPDIGGEVALVATEAQSKQDSGQPYGTVRTFLESKGWTHS